MMYSKKGEAPVQYETRKMTADLAFLSSVENAPYFVQDAQYGGKNMAACKSSQSQNCSNSKCRESKSTIADLV